MKHSEIDTFYIEIKLKYQEINKKNQNIFKCITVSKEKLKKFYALIPFEAKPNKVIINDVLDSPSQSLFTKISKLTLNYFLKKSSPQLSI